MVKFPIDYVQEHLEVVRRRGFSEEHIQGMLEGMTFIIESYKMFKQLDDNRERYIEEEYAKRTTARK